MVLVRSFMSEISPILCVSVALHYSSECPEASYQSTKASPPKIIVKNSDGSSAPALAHDAHCILPWLHTKPALRHRALLAILVVICAQLVIAEHLVCLSNLQSHKPRHTATSQPQPNGTTARGAQSERPTYLLELGVGGLVAGVLVCSASGMLVAVAMQEARGYRGGA